MEYQADLDLTFRHIRDIKESDPRVTINGLVVHKTSISLRNGGLLWKVWIGDQTGVIEVLVFQGNPRELERGKYAKISGTPRPINTEWSTNNHPNGVHLTLDEIIEVRETMCCNYIPFNFFTYTRIHNLKDGEPVDIMGTVVDVYEETRPYPNHPTNLETFTEIKLDRGKVRCSVWGDHAEPIRSTDWPYKIVIQGAKTTTWEGERQLNIGSTATLYMIEQPEFKAMIRRGREEKSLFLNTFREPLE